MHYCQNSIIYYMTVLTVKIYAVSMINDRMISGFMLQNQWDFVRFTLKKKCFFFSFINFFIFLFRFFLLFLSFFLFFCFSFDISLPFISFCVYCFIGFKLIVLFCCLKFYLSLFFVSHFMTLDLCFFFYPFLFASLFHYFWI